MAEPRSQQLWSIPPASRRNGPRSTILPPSAHPGASGPVVRSVEEYLAVLLGRASAAPMLDVNVIGDTVPTMADDLRFTLAARAS